LVIALPHDDFDTLNNIRESFNNIKVDRNLFGMEHAASGEVFLFRLEQQSV